MMAATLSLVPVLAWSAGGSNDSGLATCVASDFVTPISCVGTGQDGEYGRDATQPKASDGAVGFVFAKVCNNGQTAKKNAGANECSTAAVRGSGPLDWGCTLDKTTGITWELKTSDGFPSDYRTTHNFTAAGTFVSNLGSARRCGYDDWRLPTPSELQSIVHYGVIGNLPHLDQDWLGLDSNGDHWTSAPLASDPANQAWRIGFDRGELRPGPRSGVAYVRAMRADSRFLRQGNEATDTKTGLIWRRCPLGMTVVDGVCSGRASTADWGQALQLAIGEAAATGQAWRLPNAKELAGLVDQGRTSPAVDPVVFPIGPSLFTWSATHVPVVGSSVTNVLAIEFTTGALQSQSRIATRTVLLVRNP